MTNSRTSLDAERPKRRGAVGVILRGGRLLVIRRSQRVVAPRAYCFPGGAIEPGESEAAALVREMREELNLAVRPIRRIWTSVTSWGVELAWWTAELPPDVVPEPNPDEVESVYWCTPQEMAELPGLLESNRLFLAALEQGEFELLG